jgi:D-3-phosphoglycerate dehydrogenase
MVRPHFGLAAENVEDAKEQLIMVTIAALGDDFVLPELIESSVRDRVADPLVFTSAQFPWPVKPFGPVGNVIEASGTEDEVIETVKDASIAMTHLAPFTEKVFEGCPSLRMLAVCRGGPVNVDLDAATKAGVLVTYAPGRNAQAAAEFTVGMIMAAMRRIGDASSALHQGTWRGDYYSYSNAGMELSGSTVGIIGFGAIGKLVARFLSAFGTKILVHDPYFDAKLENPDFENVSLDELLMNSNVVSMHARLTEQSKHLLNRENLSLLQDGSVLVNTARGGLLDYDALPELLDSGRLGAVALDVYDQEPPPSSWALLGRDNVVLAPHLAGATRQTAERAAAIMAADVELFLKGLQPLNVANPGVLQKMGLIS